MEIAKGKSYQKKKAEEKHHNAPILHYKKNGQEIILYSSKYISFIN
jgi:hypothetical protein